MKSIPFFMKIAIIISGMKIIKKYSCFAIAYAKK